MARARNDSIMRFIIDEVGENPANITALVVAKFGVTRATAGNYLRRLAEDGILESEGLTKAKRYQLKRLENKSGWVELTAQTQDDDVWRSDLLPLFEEMPANVKAICAYGFTEMFNNVIDHADSKFCQWMFTRDAKSIQMMIRDYGIGIFEKITQACGLDDHRQALFELSKGKLTTDRSRHTGEGVFFTSRAFDYFSIISMDIFYSRKRDDDHQWLIDWKPTDERLPGTLVNMEIDVNSDTKLPAVFAQYEDDDSGFSKTTVSLTLARYALDQLVSRSQGKRLMARLEGFREVLLDFEDVESVGQAFADEIFRVFAIDHPDVALICINTNDQTQGMIDRARNAAKADKAARARAN